VWLLHDVRAQTFGLPNSLIVPIAARNVEAIHKYVGTVIGKRSGRIRQVNAVLIRPFKWPTQNESNVRLWTHPLAVEYENRIHPVMQVWVHVDYTAYRKAYIKFGMPPLRRDEVLDHIQNREAVRLRNYSHPYLRVCAISRKVNTSGGANTGAEGMEKDAVLSLVDRPEEQRMFIEKAAESEILYADPVDLTKMLDIMPGAKVLPGVAEMLKLYYGC